MINHPKDQQDPVFTTYKGGFGDCWATASFFLRRAKSDHLLVNPIDARIRAILPFFANSFEIEEAQQRADTVITAPSDQAAFISEHGYVPGRFIPWRTMFALPYLPTKLGWRGTIARQVVYQLTTHQGPTSCSAAEVEMLRNYLVRFGVGAISIGGHLQIGEIIKYASESALFVGIDSGMSHICHSVGTPCLLLRNRLPAGFLQVTHYGKTFKEFSDMRSLLHSLPGFIGQYLPL